ncbi:cytochrome P450 [Mycena metata]|uniref:Cytochrome P450 n=1 Tax=Mycena metata TaxID=1033252 RepID=A0AAD7JYU0_9AGAR|nr:cytochrome P450 [Mycena metata]
MLSVMLSLTILGGLIIACIVFNLAQGSKSYPPGPPSWPIFGVALNHPKTEFWRTYADWGRKYGSSSGGLISFHILGRRMTILNSAADAFNLLSKRSSIYSDRPFATMAGRLMRREKSIFCLSYNDRLKTYRKLMHQSFSSTASQMFWDVEQEEALILVDRILASPQDLVEHLRRNAAAVIMKVAYGYPVTRNDDHFVAIAEEGMCYSRIQIASMASRPGKWLVDSFPILRFVPEWFPGAGFKSKARKWGQTLYEQSLEPHNWVKEQIRAGTAVPSFTSALLQPSDGHFVDAEEEDKILYTSGALYFAGADTSVSVVKSFFFTMMMHPIVQHRAQHEVDLFFMSEHRLPTLHDQAAFPYVNAILKEVLRWAPASPFGLFHSTASPDVYKGRFLGAEPQPDPRDYAFGFGRRICPGQHLAEHSIWIQMVYSLLALTISKAVDADGKDIEPEIAFTSGVVS